MIKNINQALLGIKYLFILLIFGSANVVLALEMPIYQGDDALKINQNVIILNSDHAEGDVQLHFGNALSASLNWNSIDKLFVFTHDVSLSGNELINFRLENQASITDICDAGMSGRVYYNTIDAQPYFCNGTEWTLFGNSNSAMNDLPALQVRRSTNMTLSSSWQNVDFQHTDIETDVNIISHNIGNRSIIDIKQDGLYSISYQITAYDSWYRYEFASQVIIDRGDVNMVANGSYMTNKNYWDEYTQTATTFLVYLQKDDILRFQARRLSRNPNVINETTLSIVRLNR